MTTSSDGSECGSPPPWPLGVGVVVTIVVGGE